jgi:hypothetical protein
MGSSGPNPKPPPSGGGIRIIDGQSMYRRPKKNQISPYAGNKTTAPAPGPSFQPILVGPGPAPPKGPGPGAPPPPPIAIGVTVSTKTKPAEMVAPKRIKEEAPAEAKRAKVGKPARVTRPKPIAMKHRPPRPLAVVPTTKEDSAAKRFKFAEDEVLAVGEDTEVKPKKSKGLVKKEKMKISYTVRKRQNTKKAKEAAEEITTGGGSSPDPPPAPPPAARVKRTDNKTFAAKRTPVVSKNYIELQTLLRQLNNTASTRGLSEKEKTDYRALMQLIKTDGPEAVNKRLIKQALDMYNKSALGMKSNAKAMKA